MLTIEELDKVSIQLRDIENRKKLDSNIIEEILNSVNDGTSDYKFQCFRVLANYVAEVSENANRIAPFIAKIVFNEALFKDDNMLNVQLVLVSNILVTSINAIENIDELFSKICLVVKQNDIEGFEESIIDILDDLCDVTENNDYRLSVSMENFKILYDKIKSYVNEDKALIGDSIMLKLSARLKADNNSTDDYFRFLLNNLHSIIDDQILLNVCYIIQQPNSNTLDDTLTALLGNKAIKYNEHSASLMLLISNSMVSEDINTKVCNAIPDDFVDRYFETLYLTFTISKPWEFQSIALLNKLPVQKFNTTTKSIENYIKQLKVICNEATLQIKSDVIILQFQLISKLLESSLLNNNYASINLLLGYLKSVENCSNDILKQNIFKSYLDFLTFIEVQQLDYADRENLMKAVFQMIKIENKIDTKFLASVSKTLGVYAYKYKHTTWFQKVLSECENVIKSFDDTQDINRKDPNMQIFLNNITYTKSI